MTRFLSILALLLLLLLLAGCGDESNVMPAHRLPGDRIVASVPDTGATAGLLGLGIGAAVVFKRRIRK